MQFFALNQAFSPVHLHCSETYSFILTTVDGTKHYGYCRRYLVSQVSPQLKRQSKISIKTTRGMFTLLRFSAASRIRKPPPGSVLPRQSVRLLHVLQTGASSRAVIIRRSECEFDVSLAETVV